MSASGSGSSSPIRSRRASSSTAGSSRASRAARRRVEAVLVLPPRGASRAGRAADRRPVRARRRALPREPVGVGERGSGAVDLALDRQRRALPARDPAQPPARLPPRADEAGAPELASSTPRATGRCPASEPLERAMRGWFFSTRRHVPTRAPRADARRLLARSSLANVQSASGGALPRRRSAARPPDGRLRRELGPHGRQGRPLAAPRALRRAERRDARRPRPLPRHRPGARRRHRLAADRRLPPAALARRRTRRSLRGYDLDPARPLVLVAGNTPTNAPYEGRFVERLVGWWQTTAPAAGCQLLFRPHPRDARWQERFAAALDLPGRRSPGAELHGHGALATLLQHADCVVANAGTILLDASSTTGPPSACSTTRARRRASAGPRRTCPASTTAS